MGAALASHLGVEAGGAWGAAGLAGLAAGVSPWGGAGWAVAGRLGSLQSPGRGNKK